MLNLAAVRYRNVLAEYGGPVADIQMGTFPVRGRTVAMANASLKPEFSHKPGLALYGSADGTGVHPVASIARHMAVSEALERWAYFSLVQSDRASEFGFDVDPSTNGMAAFPGLMARQARHRSILEAVERFSLIAWWEGLAEGQPFDTDWPGVSAIAIDGPFGGVTVVAYAQTQFGGFAYGHAAGESFSEACERAVVELARNESVLRAWWLSFVAGERKTPTNRLERRCLFFASQEGHELFLKRVTGTARGVMPTPRVICDTEIPGPWSEYATVWRYALQPPSDGYRRGGDDYFFL